MGAEDLSAERLATRDAIDSLRLTRPWAFEFAPAEPNPADSVYLREVGKSDLLVLIVSRTHSAAVQAELDAAESAGVRVLAFIRKLQEPGDARERDEVIRWLSTRVKYEVFTSYSDLGGKVLAAIIAELVRGYREYRITRMDFEVLASRVPSPPGLLVRDAMPEEQGELAAALSDLVELYPNIGPWISKTLSDLGPGSDVRVADVGGSVAGIAISRDKEPGVRKFSTIYVRPGFRGEAIGPHLVYDEVKRASEHRIRKAYVTLADELRPSIGAILKRYGFLYEGVSASRYRPGVGEWVMAKTFTYQTVDASTFGRFIEDHLVIENGGEILSRQASLLTVRLPAEPLLGNTTVPETKLVISTSEDPETEYKEWAERFGSTAWLFVSLYGRLADSKHWSGSIRNWIDGEDLKARYYPIRLLTPSQRSLICTIKEPYVDALLPSSEKPQLFDPSRLQLRPDNVYYRAPDRFQALRRGSDLIFYVSSPEKQLRGHARIQSLTVNTPEECLANFGGMGILGFSDLMAIAEKHAGNVLAVSFDWYMEYSDKPKLDAIRQVVPRFNPIGASVITFEQAETLAGLR